MSERGNVALVVGEDGRARCWWPGTDPLYVAYHDDHWGVPEHDERALYEKLCLDGAQAGLSWITILRKREGYRKAFDGFVPEVVAGYGDREIERLLGDAGIVRNRQKVVATIGNARALLAMHEAGETLEQLVWSFAPKRRKRPKAMADVPATSPEGDALSKELRQRGFRFVGPTIVYAFMQAVGVVDDHVAGCWRVGA